MKKWMIFNYVLVVLLTACTKEVKVDIPGFETQVVVDGFIETGMPPFVLLSTSKNIYAESSLEAFLNGFISGAIVTVSDGTTTVQLEELCSSSLPPGMENIVAEFFGVTPEKLAEVNLCAYVSFDPAIFGQVGKTYTLNIKTGGKEFTAVTSLVQPVYLGNSYFKPEDEKPECGFIYHGLQDPSTPKDAYYYQVKRINLDSAGKERDPVFKKTFNFTFDDEFFNGLNFEFYYENPMSFSDKGIEDKHKGYYLRGDSIVVKFSKIDRGTYDFMVTKLLQLQTGGSPFSSPSNIKTNIKGGALGVWAGYSTTFDTLYFAP